MYYLIQIRLKEDFNNDVSGVNVAQLPTYRMSQAQKATGQKEGGASARNAFIKGYFNIYAWVLNTPSWENLF